MGIKALTIWLAVNVAGMMLNLYGIYHHLDAPGLSILGFGANTFAAGYFLARIFEEL